MAEQLQIRNRPRPEFAGELLKISPGTYEVETTAAGESIQITKPGYKSPQDFRVDIVYPRGDQEIRVTITHDDLYREVERKFELYREKAPMIFEALKRVYKGEDPEDVLNNLPSLRDLNDDLSMETILKVYKWIWGQEDVNYPWGQGRDMSWKDLEELARRYI